MKPPELQQWLLSEAIREDLEIVTKATVASELTGLPPEVGLSARLEHLDWERLLLAGSLLARSADRTFIEAALRIATAAVSLPNTTEVHDAGVILLQKLSNYQAARLALQRHLVEPDLNGRLGASARLEAFTRELNNSILIEHSGEWLQVNPFQQNFWNRARTPQSWVSVSAPTASGKTFLVLQWLIDEMKTGGASVAVYLAPTRALVSEIDDNLNLLIKRMSIGDVDVTSLPLATKYADAAKASKKLIYVLTQERLHLLANALNDDVRIDLLVADEAHKVGDRLRGVVLQDALERASRSNANIKIVFISPATQNPEALLEDAPASTKKEAVDSDVPTVLQNVILATQRPRRTTEWSLELRQSKDAHLQIGSITLQARPTSLRKKLALIAASIGSKGGTLVYANGAAEAEEIALLLSQLIDGPPNENDSELLALADLARRGVHESYQLAPLARKGVAFHYGNMPSLLREEIERLFRKGKIRFLVCTSTLIEGVNLSCRTIVVRGPRKGVGKPMEAHDFWNLAGRAGRWGNEFQGNIVCVDPDDLIAWPDGVPERRRYPIERETDNVFRSGQQLLDFISSRWDRSASDLSEFSQLEQVCAYLLALRLREGSILGAPFTKRHDQAFIAVVDSLLAHLASNLSLSATIAGRHSGVSSVGMQKLLNYFRSSSHDVEDLLPAPPESKDSYDRMTKIMGIINDHLYPAFQPPTLVPLHALVVLEWLKGYSLSAIIRARIAYHQRHKRPFQLPKLIRNTMELIEQTARFRAPKYISAYMEVLKLHLHEIGRSDLISNEMDVGLALEFGVSTETLVSLIELGLSRMAAVEIHEKIALDNLDRDQARKWIEEHNDQFDGMDIPKIIVAEVRRKILGKDPDDTGAAETMAS
ncbi:DEAD/DEAH box helicase [Bradyrhizobium sp. GCM10027634]|uniref:DEAD/DEAH box helicase n=1 Tax=unclassified Bradyrhizobium TaxID=2631580 RepID=UPI00188CEA2A|nr:MULTISPECIES: DEAD/DEAH box helicase [unclassified Bradyrhizobium]MDN5000671.1 DEAD/DEAH box helicase [Bradyrhizobium sp. WYCCWR 12677]QOZ42604.1 DEAD/DEAH box helicase [Bradyrhizobium sp. CCBAU 53340]